MEDLVGKGIEVSKKANKIMELGESFISGEMTFPEYLNRVQEATLSQGSLLGLTSEKDQANRRRSFDNSRRRPTGRPRIEPTDTDPGYLNRMRDDTSSMNMYEYIREC